jgi:hypothetical protein
MALKAFRRKNRLNKKQLMAALIEAHRRSLLLTSMTLANNAYW